MNHFVTKNPIQFEIRTDYQNSELEMVWRDLENRSDCTFFLSWDWIGCWAAEIGVPLQVLIGREAGRVVLLGLLAPSRRRGRLPFQIPGVGLHTTGSPEQDVITIEYNGFLVARDGAPGLTDRAEAAAIRHLLQERSGAIDELHLRNVQRTYVDMALPRSGALLRDHVWSKPSWRVDLDAIRASGRRYADSLSANTRQQIRRSMRLYEKQGSLQAVRARDVPEALAFLNEMKTLHQPYWTSRGEPGAFAFPFFERFQHRLIETCHPRGGVELIRVTRGDTPIGYLYNLIHRRQVYSYQCGFLFEADPKLKPGLVSHCLCIEMHENEGDGIYDFMAGDNRYKSNLGLPGPEMHYVVLQRPTPAIRLENGLRALRDRTRALVRRG